MIKQCQRCGADYEPTGKNQKYCSTCRILVKKEREKKYAQSVREKDRVAYNERQRKWRNEHLEIARESCRRYQSKKRKRLKIERQKAKLRAKLQAAAAKRQAAIEYHNKLYKTPSMFDGVGIPIPSQLASLGQV